MPSWLRWVREAIALISDIWGFWGFITFIAALASIAVGGVVYTRLGEEYLPPIIIGVLGIVGMLVCAYLTFKRKPAPPLGMGRVPAYPRARPFAQAGLILVPLLTLGSLAWWCYERGLPPQKTSILVAHFQPEDTNQYDQSFTGLFLVQLQKDLADEKKVEVQIPGRTITAQEGGPMAREEGERCNAAIVIWGRYGVPPGDSTAVVSANFEVLRVPEYMPSLKAEQPRPVALTHLESFAFQTQLSGKMPYLANFTAGMGCFAAGEWEDAIRSFTTTLDHADELVRDPDRSVVYFHRGFAYYEQSQYDRAIADYNLAIAFKPEFATAYNNRGVVYEKQSRYDLAIDDFNRAIAHQHDYAEAYYNLGLAYAGLSQYWQFFSPKPGYAKGYQTWWQSQVADNHEQAITNYNWAITFKTNFAEAYYNRGLVYKSMNDKTKAAADFRKVLELSKDAALREQAEEELKELE